MDEVILDTVVLVDISRRRPEALEFVNAVPSSRWLLHSATEAELLVGARDRADLRRLDQRFRHVRRVSPTPEDFDHCIAFIRRYHLADHIGWPDCLIAASALRLGVPVVTLNDKHFRVIRGLIVIRPY